MIHGRTAEQRKEADTRGVFRGAECRCQKKSQVKMRVEPGFTWNMYVGCMLCNQCRVGVVPVCYMVHSCLCIPPLAPG